jgi:hypothetical protein
MVDDVTMFGDSDHVVREEPIEQGGVKLASL